jgi:hypothetical protein
MRGSLLRKHGSRELTFEILLDPAVQLTEHGRPGAPITARH